MKEDESIKKPTKHLSNLGNWVKDTDTVSNIESSLNSNGRFDDLLIISVYLLYIAEVFPL
jgi:hypothetical protein